jgi:hypothetical protein
MKPDFVAIQFVYTVLVKIVVKIPSNNSDRNEQSKLKG